MTIRSADDFWRILEQYVEEVVSGKLLSCIYVRQACERHRRDLSRSKAGAKDFPYVFDRARAYRALRFIELLPHVKGDWAKRHELIELAPWQVFVISSIFGWVDKDTGCRRFRVAYTEVPRKNAKSTLAAAISLYMLSADGEQGAEVYCAASHREQAMAVYETAVSMVEKTPAIKGALGIRSNSKRVYIPRSSSFMKALARARGGGGGNHDSLNIHCAIVDELHAHPDSSMWRVLNSAVGSRSQPLIFAITTAGHNRAGVCYEQRTYSAKVLQQIFTDYRFFACIWTIDKEDDPFDPESWPKANPNWGLSVYPESVETAAVKAKQLPSDKQEFLTKHLNVWSNAGATLFDMREVDACADARLDIADFAGKEVCVMGCDLAAKDDFASYAAVFKKEIAGEQHYYAFLHHHNNSEALRRNPNPALQAWAEDGRITVTDGPVTSFREVEDGIVRMHKETRALEVAIDPHQAFQLTQNLNNLGIDTVDYAMTTKNLSEPTKELLAAIKAGRFHFDGDPVLSWMMSNVIASSNVNDDVHPKREKSLPHAKIDGAIALIIALGRIMLKDPYVPTYRCIVI